MGSRLASTRCSGVAQRYASSHRRFLHDSRSRHSSRMSRRPATLVVAAGCATLGYASDITRTFPINGKFSSEQRALYEVVLEAQKAAIDKARSGLQWNDIHDAAIRVATSGDPAAAPISMEADGSSFASVASAWARTVRDGSSCHASLAISTVSAFF